LPTTLYKFVCNYRGQKFGINAREVDGNPNDVVFADTTAAPGADGWTVANCTIQFPRDGTWDVIYFLDSQAVALQKVLAGKSGLLELTPEEKVALAAVSE
jgi:hypothetical protein